MSRQMYTPNQANWKMDRNQSRSTKPHLVLHKYYSRIENWRTKKILTDLKDVITQYKNAQKNSYHADVRLKNCLKQQFTMFGVSQKS